ncbi:MAG: hypothetical protein ACXACC_07355 [Promethearchaeota archaeon]|jgi:hypothetical protein
MKFANKTLVLVLLSSIIFFSFLPKTLGQTTLGDSTFPLEKDKSITWKSVNATEPYYEEIEFIRFSATDVYNTSLNGNRYMIVNYTLWFYHNFAWIPRSLEDVNAFYLSYNSSLNFLNWSKVVYLEAYLLIVPIPLNLTLISNAIIREGFLNSTINGNKLILDYYNSTKVEVTFNSQGISTILEKKTNNTTIFRWELIIEEIIIIIPFGNYFVCFMVICIVSIISIERKKIKKPTQE